MEDRGLRDIFKEEAREIIGNLESDIIRLEESPDSDIINNIFRYIHTLKGGSGVAGFDEVYEFTHQLENLLDMVRSDTLEVDEGIIELILDSIDWIKMAIFGENKAEDYVNIKNSLLERISGYNSGKPVERIEENEDDDNQENIGYNYFRIIANFKENIFEHGLDPLMIMEELISMGADIEKRVVKDRLPDFDKMDPEKCYLGWEIVLKTKIKEKDVWDVFLFVKDDNDISVENITEQYIEEDNEWLLKERKVGDILVSKGIITDDELESVLLSQDLKNKRLGHLIVEMGYATEEEVQYALNEQEIIRKNIATATVRVDTGKLDRLMNLLGEIVIGQSAITGIADNLDEEESFTLKNSLYGLDRVTREFQQQLMSLRMIPIGPSFEQFRRFVRDSSHSIGKEIILEIEGKEVELDKTVIEQIGDPLKHMIRNAIDHGIEMPHEREAAGKSLKGRIVLRAYHQEGNMFIEVEDDGKGISADKIYEKALKLGLVKKDEQVDDRKLLSFLFIPGFSTAEDIGELSGRGVGMDVVKTNIEALRGLVEIETEEGKGTIFRMKLPLTLAIIEGMLIRVGENVYIVPLLSIVESLQPKKEDVKTIERRGEVISVRGEYITLVRLYDFFGVETQNTNPWESLVVVVEAIGKRVGLMIDELMGQQQVVIKNLDNYITDNRAVSGASILGDGRVALIMDIHGLVGEMTKVSV